MHPSGFFEVLAFTLKDLEGLDPATQAVRISATVGTRKRITLQEKAISSGLKVLNARVMKKLGVTEEEPETVTEPEEDAKAEKTHVVEEPPEKPKKGKETKKPAKSTPAKVPKPAKKPAEEKAEEKTGKPTVKEPAKSTKKPVKPQVKEVPEPEEPKPKADTKSKPKSKKATAAEVKKNE